MSDPTHGWTRMGRPVHANTFDHHPTGSAYQRFNKKVAIWLVNGVGTMTCFWIFNLLSFILLAPTLAYDNLFTPPAHGFFHWYLSYGFIVLWTFLLSTYLQLVLLPGLMVGQNLQNVAADARSAKTFEDVEEIRNLVRQIIEHQAGQAAPAVTSGESDDRHGTVGDVRRAEPSGSDSDPYSHGEAGAPEEPEGYGTGPRPVA